ncbi:hypothetical protein DBP15_22560 [Streptomyces sp. CS065A]|nr:hypothetical protein DBP15_22560 [Streptomyces sp. CS065A]
MIAPGGSAEIAFTIRIKPRVIGALKPTLAVEDTHVGYDGTANPFGRGGATVTYTLQDQRVREAVEQALREKAGRPA